jgi:hypothetical protein
MKLLGKEIERAQNVCGEAALKIRNLHRTRHWLSTFHVKVMLGRCLFYQKLMVKKIFGFIVNVTRKVWAN